MRSIVLCSSTWAIVIAIASVFLVLYQDPGQISCWVRWHWIVKLESQVLIHNWNQIWLMSTAETNRHGDSNLGRPGLKLESHPCALSCSHPPSVESVSKSQSIRTKFAAPFQPIKFLQQPSKQNNYFNFFPRHSHDQGFLIDLLLKRCPIFQKKVHICLAWATLTLFCRVAPEEPKTCIQCSVINIPWSLMKLLKNDLSWNWFHLSMGFSIGLPEYFEALCCVVNFTIPGTAVG